MKLHYEREGFAKDVLLAGKLVTTKLFVQKTNYITTNSINIPPQQPASTPSIDT